MKSAVRGALVAALALSAYVAGVVVRVQQLQQVCTAAAAVCAMPGRVTPAAAEALAAAGVSLAGYAALQAAKWLIFTAIWVGVGGLILARKADEWAALAAAFFLTTFPTLWDGVMVGLAGVYPLLAQPLAGAAVAIGQASADQQFAAAVAEFGLRLRQSEQRGTATYATALQLAQAGRGPDADGYRAEAGGGAVASLALLYRRGTEARSLVFTGALFGVAAV